MAARNISFNSIMQDLKKGNYSNLYYLYGDEPYFIDCITDYIENNALAEEEKCFNSVVLYGMDTTMQCVIDNARSYPMMAERRVVIVKESASLFKDEKDTSVLESYLRNPSPYTILVFTNKKGKLDRRTKLAGQIEKSGVIFESAAVKDDQIISFINDYLTARGKRTDNKSCNLIAEAIGNDLCRICNELDKLLVAAGENDTISSDLIEKIIGVSKDFNLWEFRKALSTKDELKVNTIAAYFDRNTKEYPIYKVTAVLFPFFQNLLISYWAPDKSVNGLMAFTKINYYEAQDCAVALRNYKAVKVMEIISKLRMTDAASKGFETTGNGADGLLKELVFFILH